MKWYKIQTQLGKGMWSGGNEVDEVVYLEVLINKNKEDKNHNAQQMRRCNKLFNMIKTLNTHLTNEPTYIQYLRNLGTKQKNRRKSTEIGGENFKKNSKRNENEKKHLMK